MRVHDQRLLDTLRATVARDIEAFLDCEFPGDGARRGITLENSRTDGGLVVRPTTRLPTATLNICARLDSDRRSGTDTVASRRDGLAASRGSHRGLVFIGDGDQSLVIEAPRHRTVFANADNLSEYLLLPVFTGRPR